MKAAKILLPLALIAATPTSAIAGGHGQSFSSKVQCLFVFPVSWFSSMYVPCSAVSHRR